MADAERSVKRPNQNILDAMELVFRAIDFEPFTDESEDPNEGRYTGSVRRKSGYDAQAHDDVTVEEWFEIDHTSEDDNGHHYLHLWWDGSADTEGFRIDLDTGSINDETESTLGPEHSSEMNRQIMEGLKALMPDEI